MVRKGCNTTWRHHPLFFLISLFCSVKMGEIGRYHAYFTYNSISNSFRFILLIPHIFQNLGFSYLFHIKAHYISLQGIFCIGTINQIQNCLVSTMIPSVACLRISRTHESFGLLIFNTIKGRLLFPWLSVWMQA